MAYSKKQFENSSTVKEASDTFREGIEQLKDAVGKCVKFRLPLTFHEWSKGKLRSGFKVKTRNPPNSSSLSSETAEDDDGDDGEFFVGAEIRKSVQSGIEGLLAKLRDVYGQAGGLEKGYVVGSEGFKRIVEEGCKEVEGVVKEGMERIVNAEMKGNCDDEDEWSWKEEGVVEEESRRREAEREYLSGVCMLVRALKMALDLGVTWLGSNDYAALKVLEEGERVLCGYDDTGRPDGTRGAKRRIGGEVLMEWWMWMEGAFKMWKAEEKARELLEGKARKLGGCLNIAVEIKLIYLRKAI